VRSEEILRREAEYRAVREALGAHDVALELVTPGSQPAAEASPPDAARGQFGPSSAKPRPGREPGGGRTRVFSGIRRGASAPLAIPLTDAMMGRASATKPREAVMAKLDKRSEQHELAKLDEEQRTVLGDLATRMRHIVVGDFPELYLRVNEVRAQLEIAGKGVKKGGVVESEKKLAHALRRLNSAKFCLEVALVEVADVLDLPDEGEPLSPSRAPGDFPPP